MNIYLGVKGENVDLYEVSKNVILCVKASFIVFYCIVLYVEM